ncbi:MAG: hypothetical protein LBU32_05150 [Clostridiales bacterium]|nr:hypothetical protein [Clostridiales bacterium]
MRIAASSKDITFESVELSDDAVCESAKKRSDNANGESKSSRRQDEDSNIACGIKKQYDSPLDAALRLVKWKACAAE